MGLLLILLVILVGIAADWWSLYHVGGLLVAEHGLFGGILGLIVLVFATGFLGVAIIKAAGATTILAVRRDVYGGRMPGTSLLNGVLMFAAGVLLVLPGFVSDGIALVLLLPGLRAVPRALVRRWARRRAHVQVGYHGAGGYGSGVHGGDEPGPGRGGVVDVGRDDYKVR